MRKHNFSFVLKLIIVYHAYASYVHIMYVHTINDDIYNDIHCSVILNTFIGSIIDLSFRSQATISRSESVYVPSVK